MKDIEKAIDYFYKKMETGNIQCDEQQTCYESAIKALEKQVPKKPICKEWSIAKCPACGENLGEWLEDGYHKDYTDKKVCDCGQQLDWSE